MKIFKTNTLWLLVLTTKKLFVKVKDFYAGILNTDTKYYFLPFESAEMVKYSQNMTLASRVAISNIVFDACNKFNVDYSSIKQIAFDSFDVLGPHMTEVPGLMVKEDLEVNVFPKIFLVLIQYTIQKF